MKRLLEQVRDIAVRAGEQILDVYENGFEVEFKDDGSPLTIADQRAHRLIVSDLANLDTVLPVLSEESEPDRFAERTAWKRFWLVDPLDGTKEFIKRNGEFTVNIALVDHGRPVLGVVHAPVKGTSHYAEAQCGAFLQRQNAGPERIRVRPFSANDVVVVASRSHSGTEVQQYLRNLERHYRNVSTESMGSSLKICLVAEGSADVYPRLGPTSEWDTAAAQCVLETAGGRVTDLAGQDLVYNKSDILNPWFLASGDRSVDWTEFVSR
jgi:3'(2'), 5'-bisphosphate nucleotidase